MRLLPWLPYAVTAAVLWGVWGVLPKGPSRELSGWMKRVLFTFALIPSAIVALRSKQLGIGLDKASELAWGFVSGLLACVLFRPQNSSARGSTLPPITQRHISECEV